MPYVIAGHNEHVAWGFTACTEMCRISTSRNWTAKEISWRPMEWKPLGMDHEVIHVRGAQTFSSICDRRRMGLCSIRSSRTTDGLSL